MKDNRVRPMKDDRVSIESVIASLSAEGLLRENQVAAVAGLLESLHDPQPWYVRLLVGAGAWLASLLLIGFVAGFSLALGASTLLGAALVATAVCARRLRSLAGNDFAVQCALASSLAGQALFAWGLADLGAADELELFCGVVLLLSVVLFWLFPDAVHRVLMVLFAATAGITLIYAFELNGLIPFAGPALAAALVFVHQRRADLHGNGHGPWVQPLETGLMLSASGCLLLSTLYVLPELASDFAFYPRPWISTVLLGALLVYAGASIRPALEATGKAAARVAMIMVLAAMAAAWWAPGLLLGLIITLLGASRRQSSFIGCGLAFLALFTATYFYGIEVTMLTKSITLVATGLVVLAARWWLLRVWVP